MTSHIRFDYITYYIISMHYIKLHDLTLHITLGRCIISHHIILHYIVVWQCMYTYVCMHYIRARAMRMQYVIWSNFSSPKECTQRRALCYQEREVLQHLQRSEFGYIRATMSTVPRAPPCRVVCGMQWWDSSWQRSLPTLLQEIQ